MDVAVVGAGPAGAFAAWRLARSGHRVVVYDASHPREKPCGGGIPQVTFERFPELAKLAPLGRPHREIELRSPRGRELCLALREPIWVVRRSIFDAALLAEATAAGATHEASRITAVRVDGKGAWVETRAGLRRHDFVVGADGAASRVRRALLGERPAAGGACVAAGFHVWGLPEQRLVVEFLPDVPGYCWVFPRADHASVGIVCPARRLPGAALRARVLELLERRYPGSLALARTPYAAPIPSPTFRQARRATLGGARFALVGDAARQVDAITGEGIEHALGSAAALAGALDVAPPETAAELYAARWRASGGRELAVAARWATRWFRPAVVEACLWVARSSTDARRVMTDLLSVRQPYSKLRGRLVRGVRQRLLPSQLMAAPRA